MKAPRLTWIDYAKGIAIILVLYRHVFEGLKQSGLAVQHYISLEYANIMFFSFRMPLFFIVSGIFVASSLKKRGLGSFIATKARTILYPYFLWGSLQITLQLVFSRYVNGHRELTDYLYLLYLPREVEQFWYLYGLFNVTVLYVLVSQQFKLSPIQNIGLGIVMYYLSAWAFQNNIIIGFVGDILHYYLFFAIGDAISRFIADRDNFRYFESWKLLGLLFIPFIATQFYFLRENIRHVSEVSKYQFVEYYQPFFYIFIALAGCAFVINLTFILQKLKLAGWLQELGKHSLYIYVAHVMVLASVRVLMTKFMGIHNVPVLLVSGIIMGLTVPVILYKLSVKLNMPWIFSLEGEKKNKPVLNAA